VRVLVNLSEGYVLRDDFERPCCEWHVGCITHGVGFNTYSLGTRSTCYILNALMRDDARKFGKVECEGSLNLHV